MIKTAISFRACVLFLVVTLINFFQVVVAAAAEGSNSGGLVDIGGGRKMYLTCHGTGSPTVVLVSGLKASADDWNIAEKSASAVFPEVSKLTRVCSYDRPGTPVGEKPSRSDPVPQPTTAKDAVADLHGMCLTGCASSTSARCIGHERSRLKCSKTNRLRRGWRTLLVQ